MKVVGILQRANAGGSAASRHTGTKNFYVQISRDFISMSGMLERGRGFELYKNFGAKSRQISKDDRGNLSTKLAPKLAPVPTVVPFSPSASTVGKREAGISTRFC